MQVHFLILFLFLQITISQQFCVLEESSVAGIGGRERNAAGTFPFDEVSLSDDGNRFITENFYKPSQNGIMMFCPRYTCGRKTFPHGFTIQKMKPVMFCENHRCLNPENIKCRKTVENGACIGENEYVAGVVERQNKTHDWLEFECCHSTVDDIQPKFVKHITGNDYYFHELVVENETLIAMDYVKDIKKTKNIYGQVVYAASIFRMKCYPFNTTNVPSILESPESLIEEDGTGKFEGIPKMCNNNSDAHVFSINLKFGDSPPVRHCLPEECIKNYECKKNVKLEDCVESNQWISDFTKVENDTLVEVECCQYNDEVNATFIQYANFTTTSLQSYNKIFSQKLTEMTYFNNITVDESSENGTMYFASAYEIKCPLSEEAKAEKAAEESSLPPGFGAYFADLAKRIQKSFLNKLSLNPDGSFTMVNSTDLFGGAPFMNASKTEEEISDPPSNDPYFNETVSILNL